MELQDAGSTGLLLLLQVREGEVLQGQFLDVAHLEERCGAGDAAVCVREVADAQIGDAIDVEEGVPDDARLHSEVMDLHLLRIGRDCYDICAQVVVEQQEIGDCCTVCSQEGLRNKTHLLWLLRLRLR